MDGGHLSIFVTVVGLIALVSSVDVLARLLVCGHGLDRKEELSTSAGAGS